MRKTLFLCVIAAVVGVFAVSSAVAKQKPAKPLGGGAQLAEVRAATAKYHNVERAIADGYLKVSECVTSPPGVSPAGAMGIHYRKDALLDGQVNALTPEVLVYEPTENGRLRLVAVEYFEWAASVNNVRPTVLGQPFVGPETHGLAPHFELHAWLWKHNPAGMFAQWNPRVSCS